MVPFGWNEKEPAAGAAAPPRHTEGENAAFCIEKLVNYICFSQGDFAAAAWYGGTVAAEKGRTLVNVARNVVISGEHEGKKVVLTGDGAGIETKYKGTVPLDHTAVKEYRILWSERKRIRTLGVILGVFAFIGLLIIGGLLEMLFVTIVLGREESAGWFAYTFSGFGMVWCIIKPPFIGVYQIELLFQDGKRSVVEVSGGIYKRMKGKIADCSVPLADDEGELREYDSGKDGLGGMRWVKYWLFLALKWFCKAVSVIVVGITAIAVIAALTQDGDQFYEPAFIMLCLAMILYQLSRVFEGLAQKAKEEQEPASHERKHLEWPGLESEASVLEEIEAINDAIAGEKMSEQIDRIRDTTKKILDYQDKRPEKAAQLHHFLSYYLPATLKILKTYGELEGQGVSGGNITGTMERIEGMMDQIVACFEKQLDRLYQGEAMDIAAEVQVLERMMAKDGLSKEDFPLNQ